jgi:hypothetical protein
MRQDLKHRLVTWKNETYPGEIRKVFISENPVTKGEYMVRLERSLNGKLNHVSVCGKFLTEAQLDGHKDSSSDITHLNRIIQSLETEFNDRYEQVMHETFTASLTRFAHLN